MSGDEKRGDAAADRWRDRFSKGRRDTDLALTELDVRAEQRSQDFEENSAVIMEEALRRQQAKGSEPPSGVAKGFFGVTKGMKGDWAKVASLAILAGFLLASAYLALR